MGRTHWGDPADPPGQWQERYSKATGPSPARLHRGPWQTSPGAMEATDDRRAGTQSRRGSPAKQSGPATQATRVRRSYRRQAGAIPLVVRDTPHGWAAPQSCRPKEGACGPTHGHMWGHPPTWVKVLPWVVVGAGGLGAGKTSGAGTRGVSLDVVIGVGTGYTNTNGGESSDNRGKVHADCGPAENPSL